MVNAKTSLREVKGFFVCYPQGTKGFRIWMQEEGNCTISRNVIFHEVEVYKDSLKDVVQPDQSEFSSVYKGKSVLKEKKKCVSFSPNFIQGPSKGIHDSEASTSGDLV